MAHKHGLIEIRLDRRQAFYALIGSLLIVSVAFVVGLIVGQRMQLTGPATPGLAVNAGGSEEPSAGGERLGTPAPAADADPEQQRYSFYDDLSSQPPRALLNPSATPTPAPPAEPIGEPVAAVRVIPRATEQEDANPAAEGNSDDEAAAAPEATLVATAPTEPLEEPIRRESPHAAHVVPVDGPNSEHADAQTPSQQRRTVRRVGGAEEDGAGPEEFGYYTVEVGHFPSFAEANEQCERLRAAGHDAIVTIIAEDDGSPHQYRVQVGSFTRRTEANRTADSISGLGMRAHVIQEG